MIEHTQTTRRQIADKLSVFDHFVILALKGLILEYKFRNLGSLTWTMFLPVLSSVSKCKYIKVKNDKKIIYLN